MPHSLRYFYDENKAREYRNRQRKNNYAKTQYNRHHRERWTEKEIDLVLKHDITDYELSKVLGRSVQAIQCQRVRWRLRNGELSR